jgi:hypothetical protein
VHAKGENFLYQASRALSAPWPAEFLPDAQGRILDCTGLYCTVIHPMILQPGSASLLGLPNQTASMGLGPVKSTHLAVAEAGRKSSYIGVEEVGCSERTGNLMDGDDKTATSLP